MGRSLPVVVATTRLNLEPEQELLLTSLGIQTRFGLLPESDGQILAVARTTRLKFGNWAGNCRTLWAFRRLGLRPESRSDFASANDQNLKLGRNYPHSLDIRIELSPLSPDGQLLISGSGTRQSKFEFEQWKTASHPSGHSDYSVAISPDGQTLASGIGKIIKIWDLKTDRYSLGLLQR